MPALEDIRSNLLDSFHTKLREPVHEISTSELTREKKAQAVNALAGIIRNHLAEAVLGLPKEERPNYSLLLQYCFSVASLEYRNKVWPYEYMAFSRRVGELWEGFCSAAWDCPARPEVKRIQAPDFCAVRDSLSERIRLNIGTHAKREELISDIDTLFDIIGDINMKEDEVFSVDNTPHVIDFKSGFGSNEKGNMLRLQTVGRAYRIWNHQTRLMLLVRQEVNNNYLRVLRRSGLWEVHTGDLAYDQIAELTGADIQEVRRLVIDWPNDLSEVFYEHIKHAGLTGYLSW